ncbi:MAG: hypothetical protein HZA34_00225 [Candidatus Pacebacteria bacterium]|nr:hypothetical protein [Candidatus Paceibacterota bacterium]
MSSFSLDKLKKYLPARDSSHAHTIADSILRTDRTVRDEERQLLYKYLMTQILFPDAQEKLEEDKRVWALACAILRYFENHNPHYRPPNPSSMMDGVGGTNPRIYDGDDDWMNLNN